VFSGRPKQRSLNVGRVTSPRAVVSVTVSLDRDLHIHSRRVTSYWRVVWRIKSKIGQPVRAARTMKAIAIWVGPVRVARASKVVGRLQDRAAADKAAVVRVASDRAVNAKASRSKGTSGKGVVIAEDGSLSIDR
jgi:hypothetical protein